MEVRIRYGVCIWVFEVCIWAFLEFVYGRAEEKPEAFNQGGVLRID